MYKKLKLNVKDFVEEGTSYINYAEIKGETVNIHGCFSVLSCKMATRKSIYFHEGSIVQFFERLSCFSENGNFYLDGTIRRNKYFSTEKNNPGEFICSAINMYLATNSQIDSCRKIKFNAAASIKSDCGSMITQNTEMLAEAAVIIYDGKCQSKRQIHLKAEGYCRTGEKSDIECPLIQFSGNLVFLHGKCGKSGFSRECSATVFSANFSN